MDKLPQALRAMFFLGLTSGKFSSFYSRLLGVPCCHAAPEPSPSSRLVEGWKARRGPGHAGVLQELHWSAIASIVTEELLKLLVELLHVLEEDVKQVLVASQKFFIGQFALPDSL